MKKVPCIVLSVHPQSNREDLNYVLNIYKVKKIKHTLRFIFSERSKKMANFKILPSRTSPKGRHISAEIKQNYFVYNQKSEIIAYLPNLTLVLSDNKRYNISFVHPL